MKDFEKLVPERDASLFFLAGHRLSKKETAIPIQVLRTEPPYIIRNCRFPELSILGPKKCAIYVVF